MDKHGVNERICKKCNKPLPANYKYKKCENCRNEDVENFKKIGKSLAGIGMLAISVVAIFAKEKSDS